MAVATSSRVDSALNGIALGSEDGDKGCRSGEPFRECD